MCPSMKWNTVPLGGHAHSHKFQLTAPPSQHLIEQTRTTTGRHSVALNTLTLKWRRREMNRWWSCHVALHKKCWMNWPLTHGIKRTNTKKRQRARNMISSKKNIWRTTKMWELILAMGERSVTLATLIASKHFTRINQRWSPHVSLRQKGARWTHRWPPVTQHTDQQTGQTNQKHESKIWYWDVASGQTFARTTSIARTWVLWTSTASTLNLVDPTHSSNTHEQTIFNFTNVAPTTHNSNTHWKPCEYHELLKYSRKTM